MSNNDDQFSNTALDEIVKQLGNLSIAGLNKLTMILVSKKKEVERREINSARDEIRGIINHLSQTIGQDLTVEQIINSDIVSAPAGRGSLPTKYRDPNNPSHAWSGRGRKPQWLQKILKAGGTLENLEVTNSSKIWPDKQ